MNMITGLNHITIAVSDIQCSLEFYTNVLGFTGQVKWKTGAYLSAPGVWLCLSIDNPLPSQDYSHIAWSVEQSEFEILASRIVDAGADLWKSNRSEGDSLYFHDPDGHKLEIHVGSLQDRLTALKKTPYPGLEWL